MERQTPLARSVAGSLLSQTTWSPTHIGADGTVSNFLTTMDAMALESNSSFRFTRSHAVCLVAKPTETGLRCTSKSSPVQSQHRIHHGSRLLCTFEFLHLMPTKEATLRPLSIGCPIHIGFVQPSKCIGAPARFCIQSLGTFTRAVLVPISTLSLEFSSGPSESVVLCQSQPPIAIFV